MMSLVCSNASGHVRPRNSNEVISRTLGNGSALCDAGENETDGMFLAFTGAPLGESAGDDFWLVEETFAASAEAELGGLSRDPGFGDADAVVDFQVFLGNLKRNALRMEPISLYS